MNNSSILRTLVGHVRNGSALKVLEGASYMAGVLALFLLAIQLRSDARAARAAHSLELVQQFSSSPLSESQVALAKMWFRQKESLEQIHREGGIPEKMRARFVVLAVSEYDRDLGSDAATVAVYEIAQFYDRVEICIETAVCDKRTLHNFFGQSAEDFLTTYKPILARLRSGAAPNIGVAAKRFVEQSRAVQP